MLKVDNGGKRLLTQIYNINVKLMVLYVKSLSLFSKSFPEHRRRSRDALPHGTSINISAL